MAQDEETIESSKANSTQVKERVVPTKELFVQITGIEPIAELETHRQLKTIMAQRANEMLAHWENLGLVSQREVASVSETWKSAVVLDDTGMEQFGQYQSNFFQKAAEELLAMEADGSNNEIQDLVAKTNSLVRSIKLTSKQAGALTFRPTPLRVAESGVAEAPSAFIIINADKLDQQDDGIVNAVAYEESAHLISKLPQYEGANKKWLEETMARVVAFESDSAHQSQDTQTREASAQVLRYKDYSLLFRMINNQVGDRGETLIRMFFGREPLNSPLVAKVEEAIRSIDMVASIIDAGVSVDSLLKQS